MSGKGSGEQGMLGNTQPKRGRWAARGHSLGEELDMFQVNRQS
jgi:hypothetical protein